MTDLILGSTPDVLLDPKIIKVKDCIAGAGKAVALNNFFKSNGIIYENFTSTNALKKSASQRFPETKSQTIAAGLFTNENGHFYKDFKEPAAKTIVIDEVLQSSPRVFEWVKAHVGEYNIIITTDSNQMLAPEQEDYMMDAFGELILRPDVEYVRLDKSRRPRTDKTARVYDELYHTADSYVSVERLKKLYTIIDYENMPYTTNDIYITHTNQLENYLYLEKELANNPDVELIPKGAIASKNNPKRGSFPVISQFAADSNKHIKSYFQIANIATPTRYQGSEVIQGQKLYYIISNQSLITSREFYTVVTRLWDVDDLVIVICDKFPDVQPVTEFQGLPVKHKTYAHINYEGETQFVSRKEMNEYLAEHFPDTDTLYYDKDVVYSNKYGDKTKLVAMQVKGVTLKNYDPSYGRRVSAGSLARRDGTLNYSFMPAVYRELDKRNVPYIRAPRCHNKHPETKYEVDLTGAYPLILKYCYVPIDGLLTYKEDPERMNFYLYKGKIFTNNSVITDELAELVKTNDLGKIEYLFSTPKKIGCIPGEYLFDKAHKSSEDKKGIKEIHYGYWEKHMLKIAPTNDCYIINDHYKYELLMSSICSTLCYYMYTLKEALNGTHIVIDSVHFDFEPDDATVAIIKATLPSFFEWKIQDSATKAMLYTNYIPVKSRKEIKAEQMRNKRANMTEEEKEAQRAKDRERKRLARAAKK